MEGKKTLAQSIIESMMERHSKWRLDKDNRVYKWACYYMAKTELYDRTLTDKWSPFDNTEAWLNNIQSILSSKYAISIINEIESVSGITWDELIEEVNNHDNYTAQMWIDEFRRLWCGKENVLENEM